MTRNEDTERILAELDSLLEESAVSNDVVDEVAELIDAGVAGQLSDQCDSS